MKRLVRAGIKTAHEKEKKNQHTPQERLQVGIVVVDGSTRVRMPLLPTLGQPRSCDTTGGLLDTILSVELGPILGLGGIARIRF